MNLREYQQRVIDQLFAWWETHSMAGIPICVMPSGCVSGMTAWHARRPCAGGASVCLGCRRRATRTRPSP